MRKLVLVFIILISIENSFSQESSTENLYKVVNEYALELKNKKIDTICIYRDYYQGIQQKRDAGEPCYCDNLFIPTYIFWKDNGKTYLTRKDNCFDFEIIEIEKDFFWDIIFEHKEVIKKEEVRGFELIDKKTNQRLYSSTSHDHLRRFEIDFKDLKCEKYFKDYDLLEEQNGKLNINYNHNLLLKSKLLIDELENVVFHIKPKIKFESKIRRK